MATPPKPIKQAQQAALAPSLAAAAAAASNVVTAQELATSALPTGSENGQQLPLTENNSDANTIKTDLAPAGTGVLPSAGDSGDSSPTAGVSTDGDGSTFNRFSGADGRGHEDVVSTADGYGVPQQLALHWPVIYRAADGLTGMTYTGEVPEDAEVVAEVTADYSVQEVVELMRAHGFSAKSALNHMVDCGYQFQSEEDSNMCIAFDYY